jgi:hypothetical protein
MVSFFLFMILTTKLKKKSKKNISTSGVHDCYSRKINMK